MGKEFVVTSLIDCVIVIFFFLKECVLRLIFIGIELIDKKLISIVKSSMNFMNC